MKDWTEGWMNTIMSCPKGCGTMKGFVAEDYPLADKCPMCRTELEGFRLLKEKR